MMRLRLISISKLTYSVLVKSSVHASYSHFRDEAEVFAEDGVYVLKLQTLRETKITCVAVNRHGTSTAECSSNINGMYLLGTLIVCSIKLTRFYTLSSI